MRVVVLEFSSFRTTNIKDCKYVKAALTYLHMMTLTDIEKLREVALDQHGLVTTVQAEEVGVSRQSLAYLVKHNRIERVSRGIFRVAQVPMTGHEALQLALLWAGDDSFLSHDTALAAWDVCDVNPTQVFVTVPKKRRISKAGGQNIVVCKDNVSEEKLKWWEQMRVASLRLAIEQCIGRGTPSYLLVQAIKNGRSRGLITKDDEAQLYKILEVRDGQQ